MLEWTPALTPPAYIADPERPPEGAYRAELPGGEHLCALCWGLGSETSPYILQIIFEPLEPPEGGDLLPSRYPTFEEMHSAVDHILPEGVLLVPAGFSSTAPENRPEVYGPGGIMCSQVGAKQGSAAARRSLIHIPHGTGGPHHA